MLGTMAENEVCLPQVQALPQIQMISSIYKKLVYSLFNSYEGIKEMAFQT